MAIEKQYLSDVAAILSHRHDNGADLWATPDNKLLKGSPFSTFDSVLYLLDIQYKDGGWRCNKFSFGHGEETEYSNPQPTLNALDAFRFSQYLNNEPALDRAVEFLLEHWVIRKPIGPCHYRIGTLFMQVEYPFRNYNLFQYVYVLSFYGYAKNDRRFLEAFETLKSKTVEGKIVVERVAPKLAKLSFCRKGFPSELATRRYSEILENLNKGH